VIFRYFELLSARSNDEIVALKKAKTEGRDPREIKALFAREIVTRVAGGVVVLAGLCLVLA
jgi:tyrosyl-tRNA synthetase